MNTFQEIYKLVAKIPEGKVTTYGIIAKKLGISNPRVVGYALHANKNSDEVPCHRVVSANGELAKGYAFGGLGIQKQLLVHEGIKFNQSKVELGQHLFYF